jgi:hypothetical protein
LIVKQTEIVSNLQKSIDYIEEEKKRMCLYVVNQNQLSSSNLQENLKYHKILSKLTPNLTKEQTILTCKKTEAQLEEDKKKATESSPPPIYQLQKMEQDEKKVFQKWEKLILLCRHEYKTMNIIHQEKRTSMIHKFTTYLKRHGQLSFQQRKAFEWKLWTSQEQLFRQEQGRFLLLQKNVVQSISPSLRPLALELQTIWQKLTQKYLWQRQIAQVNHLQAIYTLLQEETKQVNEIS